MRKERLSARKGKALRRVLLAAATLFLVNHILLVGLLFPFQALRRLEEREGTGRTAVLRRDWPGEITWNRVIYLSGNANAVMLSDVRLGLFGWVDYPGVALDCSGDGPLWCGWMSLAKRENPRLFYVFGRVDDPEITRVEVSFQYVDWNAVGGEARTVFSWTSEEAEWMERDGSRYFLIREYPVDWRYQNIHTVAVGYDAEGAEIARSEVERYVIGNVEYGG